MLLEPMYMLMGRNFEHDDTTYDFEECSVDDATSVIFASEPLTESIDDWSTLEFGEIVFLERDGENDHQDRRPAEGVGGPGEREDDEQVWELRASS